MREKSTLGARRCLRRGQRQDGPGLYRKDWKNEESRILNADIKLSRNWLQAYTGYLVAVSPGWVNPTDGKEHKFTAVKSLALVQIQKFFPLHAASVVEFCNRVHGLL